MTALGIHLFTQKVAQKRWYWETESAGGYSKVLAYNPIKHCIEPFYRVDMRVFFCGERLKYDFYEHLSGYSEEQIGYIKTMYEFIKNNYPQCMPKQGFWKYINCSIGFKVDAEHRMLGQIGVGENENYLGFYTGLAGKEMVLFIEQINEYEPKILGNSLADIDEDCSNYKNARKIIYRGKPYIFRNAKTKEFRFHITCQSDVEQVIKIMKIKAICKQNTI